MISALCSGSIMILICLSISADHKRLQERQAMERQLEGQRLHYAELKVRVEDARKTNHDFKHHIAAIRHYMDIDDKEGLRRYCDDLTERTTGQGRIPYTGNAAADSVLYHYMQRALGENVAFHHAGTIRSTGIADVDLCVLLGNALDNAFAGCLTIPGGRQIDVISQSEPHLLSIMIRNTFDGVVQQRDDALMSRKRENRKGVGIASMRSVCQRYGGSLDTRWEDGTFTVMIMLPLNNENNE